MVVEASLKLDESGILSFADLALGTWTQTEVRCTMNFDKMKKTGTKNYGFIPY